MDSSAEPTTPAIDGDMTSTAPKKRLAEKFKCHILAYTRWRSITWPNFTTLAFLVGSTALIILSQFVPVKRSFSNSLNPSCTDFGDSVAEQRFALDLAYGKFTFTQAKIIDVTWDTVVGQGGRILHGWILYRCIIYPLLILAMEISTVTYPYYTALSFSKASFETLTQLLRTLHLTRSFSVLLCTILLVYTLTYTLFFSLIWGTATGYISLSHKLYAMPEGDIVPLTSEDLTLCWVLDPTRHEWSNKSSIPYIEVGPSFSKILSTRRSTHQKPTDLCLNITSPDSQRSAQVHLQYGFSGWTLKSAESTIWDLLADTEEKGFGNFMNIQRYAITRQFLQIGLDTSDWVDFGWKANLSATLFKSDEPVILDWSSNKSSCRNISQKGLYPTLHAVTLEKPGQRPSTQDVSNLVDIYPYNESSLATACWSPFVLNQSVKIEPGIVPYNSTLRLNDNLIPLNAPFLDVGFNCSAPNPSAFNNLGNCVCYKGQPISLGLLDHPICNTAPGYVWGFSSSLIRIGLILEAVWMACCFVAYPWLLYRSKLLRTEPVKSAKALRLLLDCSEAIYNDIGLDTKDLRENEIVQRLKNIKIGYHSDEHEGKLRYRVVSDLTTKGLSERFHEGTSLIETEISNVAHKFASNLDKTMPILNRIGNSSVHDRMNEWLEGAIAVLRSYLPSRRRQPTAKEVYADVNWRF